MIPIFILSGLIFHGEDERAYQPRETKRILSPWLTPTINTGDPSRTLSFSALIFICRHRASISRLYDAHDDPSGSPLNGINTLKQKWVPRSFESTYPPTPGVDPSYPRTSFPSGFQIELNLWSSWFTREWVLIVNTEPKLVDDFILLRLYPIPSIKFQV